MEVRPLSDSLQTRAKNELNEDPLKTEEDIKLMREWLKKQPHLVARQDDQFILNILRVSKFSIQKAKQRIDYYYTIKTIMNEQFTDRAPLSADIELILNAGGILPLPVPGLNDSRIILYRWAPYDPTTMPFLTIIKVLYMILEILMEEDDNTIVSGVHVVIDYKDFPLGYFKQMTPSTIQKSAVCTQSCYPLRFKGLDIINIPTFFDSIYAIIKLALSQKANERTKISGSDYADTLYNRVPLDRFPKEYGGCAASINELAAEWKTKVQSYRTWFLDNKKYYCKEELRPVDSETHGFGVDGSFRKLNVD